MSFIKSQDIEIDGSCITVNAYADGISRPWISVRLRLGTFGIYSHETLFTVDTRVCAALGNALVAASVAAQQMEGVDA